MAQACQRQDLRSRKERSKIGIVQRIRETLLQSPRGVWATMPGECPFLMPIGGPDRTPIDMFSSP